MIPPYTLKFLKELRQRVVKVLIFFLVIALSLSLFAKYLFIVLALPLLQQLIAPQQLIATQLTAPLLIPIKFAFYCAAFVTLPYFFYQLWYFVVPGLYRQEKYYVVLFLGGGLFFFILGVIVAYTLILPNLLSFMLLASPPPNHLTVMPDLTSYFNFVMTILWSFGLAFELPLVMLFLVLSQCLSLSQLKKARRFVVVLTFIVAMFIAPDILSQCFLALPLYLLYELGIVMSQIFVPRITVSHTH